MTLYELSNGTTIQGDIKLCIPDTNGGYEFEHHISSCGDLRWEYSDAEDDYKMYKAIKYFSDEYGIDVSNCDDYYVLGTLLDSQDVEDGFDKINDFEDGLTELEDLEVTYMFCDEGTLVIELEDER